MNEMKVRYSFLRLPLLSTNVKKRTGWLAVIDLSCKIQAQTSDICFYSKSILQNHGVLHELLTKNGNTNLFQSVHIFMTF